MANSPIDPALVLAWLTARSAARDLPAPVPDRGGFRVDTHSERELQRWVFPCVCDGLRALGHTVTAERHFLKLCGGRDELRDALPSRWEIQAASYFMATRLPPSPPKPLPEGYEIKHEEAGPKTHVRVIAPDGSLAAGGYAAEVAGVFIYDRIETALGHRRKGLGACVMSALGSFRQSSEAPQLLVATEEGRQLYTALGWSVLSPYSTAAIQAQIAVDQAASSVR